VAPKLIQAIGPLAPRPDDAGLPFVPGALVLVRIE
jgi:hypothetical protein